MRGASYIEGPRPVRSGLRPPPSSLANLYRDETRARYDFENRRTQFVQGVFAKAIGARRVAAFDRRVEALPPPRTRGPGL